MDWRVVYEGRVHEYERRKQESAQRMRQLWAAEAAQKSSRCMQVPNDVLCKCIPVAGIHPLFSSGFACAMSERCIDSGSLWACRSLTRRLGAARAAAGVREGAGEEPCRRPHHVRGSGC